MGLGLGLGFNVETDIDKDKDKNNKHTNMKEPNIQKTTTHNMNTAPLSRNNPCTHHRSPARSRSIITTLRFGITRSQLPPRSLAKMTPPSSNTDGTPSPPPHRQRVAQSADSEHLVDTHTSGRGPLIKRALPEARAASFLGFCVGVGVPVVRLGLGVGLGWDCTRGSGSGSGRQLPTELRESTSPGPF